MGRSVRKRAFLKDDLGQNSYAGLGGGGAARYGISAAGGLVAVFPDH